MINRNNFELIQYLDNCLEDAEAITQEIYSLRLELKAFKDKIKPIRQKLEHLNCQLPNSSQESELSEYSDCDWLA